ncbi:MAG: hypothetical protein Ta2B_15410 [Termitinemataceae bacterium]|nr:MAG: hypothetical protein Ta2B_15410 [Termitinemataceae bacterium]
MTHEFLVNFSTKENILNICRSKEFWLKHPGPIDFFEREYYRFVPENIKTEDKTRIINFFEKARFWGCFVKIDIEADTMDEAKVLLKTNSHLFVVFHNMTNDKSLSYSIESFIIFDKKSFEVDLEEAMQSQIPNFKWSRKNMTYESNLLQSEVTVYIENGGYQVKADFQKSNIRNHLKHKKDPITDEWYFGEDEFRYLLTTNVIEENMLPPNKVVVTLNPSTIVDVGTYDMQKFFKGSIQAFDLDKFNDWQKTLADSSNLVLLCNPETAKKLKDKSAL